ncbi:MAG TPA: DUF2381 family protein [Archangium sp.]|nr:DUF2381 family protein [Archangium sp.]
MESGRKPLLFQGSAVTGRAHPLEERVGPVQRCAAGVLGFLGVSSFNTKQPYVALAQGLGAHWPGANPGAPPSLSPLLLPSRPANTRLLPPHLQQANTSRANVLRSNPARVPSWCALLLRLLHRRGKGGALLLPLRPRPCLGELVASEALRDGERVPVTVYFEDGAAPADATFVLVIHPS